MNACDASTAQERHLVLTSNISKESKKFSSFYKIYAHLSTNKQFMIFTMLISTLHKHLRHSSLILTYTSGNLALSFTL